MAASDRTPTPVTRRRFLTHAGAAALSVAATRPTPVRAAPANGKLEVGCIGLGTRGTMIANMLVKHGGYHIKAVADYFPNVVNRAGESFGVPAHRRYHGLSGYQQLIRDGVDAVFLETPPYCFPDHVEAAVKAGCHVYMAKPVACDAPGCQRVWAAARRAQANDRVFLVDFQTRTDPFFIEGIQKVHEGLIGPVGLLSAEYNDEAFADPPLTENVESRLQRLIWVNDTALGGSYFVNAGIHAIDVALWIAGEVPVQACGSSRIARENPHGDSHDVYSLTYTFPSGLILNHRGEHLKNRSEFRCDCLAQGAHGYLESGYTSRVRILGTRNGYRGGDVKDLYPRGAEANIASFHQAVTEGRYDNPTVEPSMLATMTTLLGREAAARNTVLTWDDFLAENKALPPDLTGLQA